MRVALWESIFPSPVHTRVRESVFCPTLSKVAGKVREKFISGMMLMRVFGFFFFSMESTCTCTKRILQKDF